ncbi:MAG: TIGR02217 family protein, partial [Alphaproteobacteria bacterium]|nr:TIGR02217 family protein [Alphaproteobacteria bacterium]
MAFWLCAQRHTQDSAFIKRFDPRFWTVDFPRPMMAAVTTPASDTLRVDAVFYNQNDLCGLIWWASDSYDHPLLAYETSNDFSGCVLAFQWQSSGVLALDAANGPTLTIEGFDASGAAQTWYIRLWNYAAAGSTNTNAAISLDFSNLIAGWSITGGTPIYTGNITRMFISLVPAGYTNAAAPLSASQEAWVTLTGMKCDGPGSTLTIGDVLLPPHALSIATGYDDAYNQSPARLLRNAFALGYRGDINHYVGMSHYPRLEANSGGWYASLSGGVLNVATTAWHTDFTGKAKAKGYGLILSLSYELLDQYCWGDWKQVDATGAHAQTGYTPPSTLLSPANANAMSYLHLVAVAFVGIAVAAGLTPKFQVGEPWWWVQPDGAICLYDAAAKAALGGAPVIIQNVRVTTLTTAQQTLLDQAGALLSASTAALIGAVKTAYPTTKTHLLTYLPT